MEPEVREQKLKYVQLIESLVQAIDRREDVFRAIASTDTEEEAHDAVAALLGVGNTRARAVLDMQARHWTPGHRRKLVDRIEELRAELDAP